MKKFALHKTLMLVAALAIGSAGIAGDALARGGGGGGGGGGFGGGGGGGHGGGGFGGGGFGGGHAGGGGFGGGHGGGHFAGGGGNMSHFGGGYSGNHVNNYGHNDNRHVRVVSPYLFDNYGYDSGYYGYDNDCWTSQRVRTRAGWRYRSVWACY